MHKGLLPGGEPFRALLGEMDLPVAVAKRQQVAVVTPVQEAWAWVLFPFALPIGEQIEPVDIDLERLLPGRVSLLELRRDVRLPGRSYQRGEHVLMGEDVVADSTRLDHTRPADHAGHSPGPLPVSIFLTSKRRGPAVRPAKFLSSIVGGVHDDGIFGDPKIIEFLEELSDVAVVLHHPIGIHAETRNTLRLLLEMRENVHPSRVEPAEERLAVLSGGVH